MVDVPPTRRRILVRRHYTNCTIDIFQAAADLKRQEAHRPVINLQRQVIGKRPALTRPVQQGWPETGAPARKRHRRGGAGRPPQDAPSQENTTLAVRTINETSADRLQRWR
jgi:hypothetical protein